MQIVYSSCLLFIRKSGRVADCVCLENRSPERVRGFESYLFRFYLGPCPRFFINLALSNFMKILFSHILYTFCSLGALSFPFQMKAEILDDSFDWKKLQGSKLGYYIGSFDPIHLGHQNLIEQALQSQSVDYVLVYPAPGGDHFKNRSDLAIRQKMILSVYENNPNVLITKWTPKELQDKFTTFTKNLEIIGMIGSDVVTEVLLGPNKELSEKYHQVFMRGLPIKINHATDTVGALMALEANSFLVALRGSVDLSYLKGHINDRPIKAFLQSKNNSSTEVRNAILKKQPFDQYLSPSVYEIIKKESLYEYQSSEMENH